TRTALVSFAVVLSLSAAALAQSVQTTQPEIPGVVAAGTTVQLIKDGFQGTEGPVGTPDGGLYFTDPYASKMYKMDKNGNVTLWREDTGGTSGIFLLKNGRLLGAETGRHRLVAIDPDGKLTPLATAGVGGRALRLTNDIMVDKKGGIYFTDPAPFAFAGQPEPTEKPPGFVYYLTPKGNLTLIDDQITRPNGISLSFDGKILFVADTDTENLWAFDVQPDGTTKNRRSFVKLHDPQPRPDGTLRSGADGMAIDTESRLYVTTSSGVQVIDRRGQYLGTIRVPKNPSNLAFGGPDRRTLYITGRDSLFSVKVLSQGPSDRAK
ncbi:MAG: gluconolactonase, partial [Acidobacteria bacterium]